MIPFRLIGIIAIGLILVGVVIKDKFKS